MEYITKRMASQLWWSELHPYTKLELTARFYEGRVFTTLTGREIEKIFDKKDEPVKPEEGTGRYIKQTIDLTTLKQQVYGSSKH